MDFFVLFVVFTHLLFISCSQFSLLKPWLYLTIFCTVDLIAIVVQVRLSFLPRPVVSSLTSSFSQAVGGAMAAIALKNDDSSSSGTHIMVAGVAIQLAGYVTSFFSFPSLLIFCFSLETACLPSSPSVSTSGVALATTARTKTRLILSKTVFAPSPSVSPFPRSGSSSAAATV